MALGATESPRETSDAHPGSTTGSSNGTSRSSRGGRMAAWDISILFLLLAMIQLQPSQTEECVSDVPSCLRCFHDLERDMTCVWNVTCSGVTETTTYKLSGDGEDNHKTSCYLKPLKDSLSIQNCTLHQNDSSFFADKDTTYKVEVLGPSDDPVASFQFCLMDYVKMHPPGRPVIENYTISWSLGYDPSVYIEGSKKYELQWKREEQPWEVVSLQDTRNSFDLNPEEERKRGAWYQARVRVRPDETHHRNSDWSDWSPTASWKSTAGAEESADEQSNVFVILVAVGGAVAILIFSICFRRTKTIWIYIYKKVQGPPLPNLSMFFPGLDSTYGGDFNSWLSSEFTSDSFFQSFLRPVDISPVEITNTLDNVAPFRPDAVAALWDKKMWNRSPALLQGPLRACDSSSRLSCYSNESYSLAVCPALPTSGGRLAPCAVDSPYGPAGGRTEEVEEDEKGGMIRKVEIDSGLGGEFSQESLDAVDLPGDAGEEGDAEDEDKEGDEREQELMTLLLLCGDGAIKGGNALQVSSSYQRLEALQMQTHAPNTPDSGDAGWGGDRENRESHVEETRRTEDGDDVGHFGSNVLQFHSCSSPLTSPQPGFDDTPLAFPWKGLLPPVLVPSADCTASTLEELALMSSSMALAPSSDGYMPVTQSQT